MTFGWKPFSFLVLKLWSKSHTSDVVCANCASITYDYERLWLEVATNSSWQRGRTEDGMKRFSTWKGKDYQPPLPLFANQSFYILPFLKDFCFDYINRVSKLDQIGLERTASLFFIWDRIKGDMGRSLSISLRNEKGHLRWI